MADASPRSCETAWRDTDRAAQRPDGVRAISTGRAANRIEVRKGLRSNHELWVGGSRDTSAPCAGVDGVTVLRRMEAGHQSVWAVTTLPDVHAVQVFPLRDQEAAAEWQEK